MGSSVGSLVDSSVGDTIGNSVDWFDGSLVSVSVMGFSVGNSSGEDGNLVDTCRGGKHNHRGNNCFIENHRNVCCFCCCD